MSQEIINKREELENKAIDEKLKNNHLPAVEILMQAMDVQKIWYQYILLARWLYDLGRLDESEKAIIDGFNSFSDYRFYFHWLRANLYWLAMTNKENVASNSTRAVALLDIAFKDIVEARNLFEINPRIISEALGLRVIVQGFLKSYLGLVNPKEAFFVTENSIKSVRQSLIMFNMVIDAENRLRQDIRKNEDLVHSERIRTIELLGIFTAIFAFLFAGVQIFSKMSLHDGLILQGGMALLMIVFFLGMRLVIYQEARTKLLVSIFTILLSILLFLPLYAEITNKPVIRANQTAKQPVFTNQDSNGINFLKVGN